MYAHIANNKVLSVIGTDEEIEIWHKEVVEFWKNRDPECPEARKLVMKKLEDHEKSYVNLEDIADKDTAENVAKLINEFNGNDQYHATTSYGNFKVTKKPAVGDEVSRAFNGDYRPCGEIVKISKTSKKITTSTGHIFWRQGNSSRWLFSNTYSMVYGHHTETTKEF